MNKLYLELNMGAAGDMLMSALLELYPEKDEFIETMNNCGIPNVHLEKREIIKCGIKGMHIDVKVGNREEESVDVKDCGKIDHDHEHQHHEHHHHHEEHSSMHSITHIIESLKIPDNVKKDALSVYNLIADAESHVHGKKVEEVHFHEVGAMDAVADIVGVCLLTELLKINEITSSSVNVGSGQVQTAHGILPVPTPATAYLLKNIPTYSNGIRGELCTPTGAALIKYFSTKFEAMPLMQVEAIGYGMGTKDFVQVNCVRAFVGK